MRKAPSNLFSEDKQYKRSSGGAPVGDKYKKQSGKNGSQDASQSIWFGVHEINDMAREAKVRPRSMPRLRQEELKALGSEGPKKGATPLKIGRAMSLKHRQLSQKLRMRDRDVGMLTDKKEPKKQNFKLEKDDYLRKLKGNRSGLSRGNQVNTDALVGKYRDGVLSISKSDIDTVRANRKR